MKSKVIKLATIFVSISLVAAVILKPSFSRNIENSIVIERSPDQVWTAIADIDQYANWSPFIKSVQGELKTGETLLIEIVPQGEDGMEFTPQVLVAKADEELRWIGKLGFRGVFDGEHYFILEKLEDNRTRLRHGEAFSGLLVPILWGLIADSTRKGFTDHNQSLKTLVESSAAMSLTNMSSIPVSSSVEMIKSRTLLSAND